MRGRTFVSLILIIVLTFSIQQVISINNQQLDLNQQNRLPNILFNLTLLAPSTCCRKNQFIALLAQELPKIGIGVSSYEVGWTLIIPRTFGYVPASPEDGIPTFENGGYDVFIIGLAGDLQYAPAMSYSSEFYSPSGNNFAYFKNNTIDNLIKTYDRIQDPIQRLSTGYQIQQIAYQEVPYIPLVSTQELWVHSINLPWTKTDFQMITLDKYNSYWSKLPALTNGNSDLVFETPFTIDSYELFPNTNEWYLTNPISSKMYERDPNDPNYAYKPVMAAEMPVFTILNDTSGQSYADVKLKSGVTFSNGDPVTVEDIVNTYRMAMTPKFRFTNYYTYLNYFDTKNYGNNSVIAVGNDVVRFYLSQFYWDTPSLFNEPVLDENIVGNWTTPATYDLSSDPMTYSIGTGPFILQTNNTNVNNSTVKIARNQNWWGENVIDWYGGSQAKISSILFKTIGDKSSALTELNSGVANIIDGYFGVRPEEIAGNASISSNIVSDLGIHFLSVNMHHPIIGTGIDTPLGKSDPNKAAIAARYVRQAISYMINQTDIIDNILLGVGTEATSLWPSASIGYDTSIPVRQYNFAKAMSLMEKAGYSYIYSSSSTKPAFLDFSFDLGFISFLVILDVFIVKEKRRRDKN